MLWVFLTITVLFNLIFLVLRNLSKSTLLVILFSLLFFTFGHMVNLLEPAFLTSRISLSTMLLVTYGLIFLAGTFLIFRAKKIPTVLFNYLLIVFGLLVVFNLIQIVRSDPRISAGQSAPPVAVENILNPQNPPDVYLIILDSYDREDLLLDYFGYDNSVFITALEERGFYVPECALSNYERTHIAIPAILNMNYADQMGIPDTELDILTPHQVNLILNSQARQIFTELGYNYVTARGYGAFNDIQDADIYLNYYYSQGQADQLAERNFLYLFIRTTLLRAYFQPHGTPLLATGESASSASAPLDTSGLGYEEASFWYNQTNYVFDSLAELPEEPGNYFVYAHINAPHSPYVYNPDGSFRFVTDYSDEKTLYTDAITALNERVLELVDTLIADSDVPPVIIIESDHGAHFFQTGINHHKILSAYYLPGEIDQKPYPTITQVNSLRLVLHDYFDPSVTLLPDTIYVMESDGYHEMPASCDLR